MATAESVVLRKQRKTNIFNNTKNDEDVTILRGYESHGQTDVVNNPSTHEEICTERVFEINLHASKVSKIENFEKFRKLRCLDLSCNEIQSIEGFDKNLELKELKLYSNRIKTVEKLDKLKELWSLQLQHNEIRKIGDGLQSLKKLKNLRVDCNKIQNVSISELSPCSKLVSLNLSNNEVKNISFINCLPHLEEFYVSHNQVSNIPDLGRCKKLEELDVSFNKISSIVGIKSLQSIKVLHMEHNQIYDFDISGAVSTLEVLYAGNNMITTVQKLPLIFPSLELLDLSFNKLQNLPNIRTTLAQCSLLKELIISDNPCYDSTSLDRQTCLETLPNLEILNGIPTKRPRSSQGKIRPPMRPMSASHLVSSRLLEEQVRSSIHHQNSFESMISSKFDILYDLLKQLPETKPDKTKVVKRVAGNSIEEDSTEITGQLSTASTQDSKKNMSPRLSVDSPRPSSRCSNRARLHDAIMYAEQHFDK